MQCVVRTPSPRITSPGSSPGQAGGGSSPLPPSTFRHPSTGSGTTGRELGGISPSLGNRLGMSAPSLDSCLPSNDGTMPPRHLPLSPGGRGPGRGGRESVLYKATSEDRRMTISGLGWRFGISARHEAQDLLRPLRLVRQVRQKMERELYTKRSRRRFFLVIPPFKPGAGSLCESRYPSSGFPLSRE